MGLKGKGERVEDGEPVPVRLLDFSCAGVDVNAQDFVVVLSLGEISGCIRISSGARTHNRECNDGEYEPTDPHLSEETKSGERSSSCNDECTAFPSFFLSLLV